ncbi:heterokaryon incompatibility protein [Colletotrichum kahawae]|uniref:Heterokaryon incompatibility protein n=1 Tax=Colletotrichum kahawae TaxID=34407 RepID=A0AAD9YID9_COLKA|nr:heterokaryon incompatibility protein [Colletotrichum kahawae]
MAICKLCRMHVLESNRTWGFHHISAANLHTAAEVDCIFCRKLAGFVATVDHRHHVGAFYRWSIRDTAQIRETNSYISITFRPVSSREQEAQRAEELPEVRFDLFPKEDLGTIPSSRSFGSRTDCEASRKQMKSWLKNCLDNHPKCKARHADRDFMPTRVLDIGASDSVEPPTHVRVVETKQELIKTKDRRYMTLSHCWGRMEFVRLTAQDHAEFTTHGIAWESSSSGKKRNDICSNKNFAEAIQTARKLGIRYIWIDSICIIQNSVEDWECEAKLMHKVYRNSYCNLAAVDSQDGSGGLFRHRSNDVLPAKFESEGFSHRFRGRSWRIVSSDLWDMVLLQSPLYTRGWVFQENVCFLPASSNLAETNSSGTVQPSLHAKLSPTGFHAHSTAKLPLTDTGDNACKKPTSVTGRCLTYHTDKDEALWGIAKLMRDMLGQEYAHGLWSDSLEEQLAWRVASGPKVMDLSRECELESSFPSWSWTYLDVSIQPVPRFRGRPRFYKVTDHSGDKLGFQFENPFRGWLKRNELARENGHGHIATEVKNDEKNEVAQADITWRPDERSKLRSAEIPLQGHICRGALISVPGSDRWMIVIDGVQGDAIIEAFPDIVPSGIEVPCEFLVLAASRVIYDELGSEVEEADYTGNTERTEDTDDSEDADGISDVQYSGVGILMERAGDDRLRRYGAVAFRQICLRDWENFQLACGASLDWELDAKDGQKMWLV